MADEGRKQSDGKKKRRRRVYGRGVWDKEVARPTTTPPFGKPVARADAANPPGEQAAEGKTKNAPSEVEGELKGGKTNP